MGQGGRHPGETPMTRPRIYAPGGEPEEWEVVRRRPGEFVILDADGFDALNHPDRVARLYNWHDAAAAKILKLAVFHSLRAFEELVGEKPYLKWVIELDRQALERCVPRLREFKQAKCAQDTQKAA